MATAGPNAVSVLHASIRRMDPEICGSGACGRTQGERRQPLLTAMAQLADPTAARGHPASINQALRPDSLDRESIIMRLANSKADEQQADKRDAAYQSLQLATLPTTSAQALSPPPWPWPWPWLRFGALELLPLPTALAQCQALQRKSQTPGMVLAYLGPAETS